MNKKFDYKNRLNKKDCLYHVNLRDGRFEVLDSSRTLDNIELMNNASTIAGAVRSEEHTSELQSQN